MTTNLDLTKVTLTELHECLLMAESEVKACVRELEKAKLDVAPIQAELERRYGAALAAEYNAQKKQSGTVRLELPEDFEAVADASKKVEWDSGKLMAVASTMSWDQASKLFKIDFSVPEKIYSGLAAANPELAKAIDAARAVKYGKPKITLQKRS